MLAEGWTHDRLAEVVHDAQRSSRLTEWEREFVASIWKGMRQWRDRFDPTAKQLAVLARIEKKIYDAG